MKKNALIYLWITTMKNRIKELGRNPGRLVLTLVVIVLLGFSLVTQLLEPGAVEGVELRSIEELYAMAFALYFIIFVAGSWDGLKSGATFYSMADVGLLFPSPISHSSILNYGLIKQAGTSLLIGFFLIYQYSWINELYGIDFGVLVLLLIGYGVTFYCSKLTAMAIYCFSSGSESRQNKIRWTLYILYGAVVAYLLLPALFNSGDFLNGIVNRANAPLLDFFPIIGWIKSAVIGLVKFDIISAVFGIVLTVIYIVAVVYAIRQSESDYYEDVLQATEVTHSAITAQKEGKAATPALAKVKIGKTGIGRGAGASVLFYKHLLESRRSRVFLLDNISMIFAVISIVFAYFLREEGLLPIFVFSVYLQFFTIGTGRWARDLLLPYVYMIPVSPFAKLVMLCGESVLKLAVESTVIFIPAGLLASASAQDIVICILARVGFGVLCIACNFLIERIAGTLYNKALIMVLYLLAILLFALPGIIAGSVLAVLLPPAVAMLCGLGATLLWNLVVSALILFLCRKILDYAELNHA